MQQHPYHQPNQYQQGQQMIEIGMGNPSLELLARLPCVYIKQRLDILENLVCWEKKNTYFVYPVQDQQQKPDFKHATPLFKCKEQSSCFQRTCLPGACRAFEMKIKQFNQDTVIRFKRDYKCTFLCCGRPTMEVVLESGQKLGSIFFPFLCCDKGVIIRDANDQLMYSVMGSCCQWPFCVNMPCETCQKARFDVIDANGQIVSEIWKESPGCCAACIGDADNFRVIFPPQSTGVQKALLMAATLFIDYNYFEESPQDQNIDNNT